MIRQRYFKKLPKVLIIGFKRFNFPNGAKRGQKLTHNIRFKDRLNVGVFGNDDTESKVTSLESLSFISKKWTQFFGVIPERCVMPQNLVRKRTELLQRSTENNNAGTKGQSTSTKSNRAADKSFYKSLLNMQNNKSDDLYLANALHESSKDLQESKLPEKYVTNEKQKKDDFESRTFPFKSLIESKSVLFKDEYHLQALTAHHGMKISTGHYTAAVKRGKDWFGYNDKTVSILSDEEVFQKLQDKVYITYWVRK